MPHDPSPTTGPAVARRSGRNGGVNLADRLDHIEAQLGAVAEACDAQAAALVGRVDELTTAMPDLLAVMRTALDQLDRIEAKLDGQAIVLGAAVPPLIDATQLVGEAQRVGLRRAWRNRRKASRPS